MTAKDPTLNKQCSSQSQTGVWVPVLPRITTVSFNVFVDEYFTDTFWFYYSLVFTSSKTMCDTKLPSAQTLPDARASAQGQLSTSLIPRLPSKWEEKSTECVKPAGDLLSRRSCIHFKADDITLKSPILLAYLKPQVATFYWITFTSKLPRYFLSHYFCTASSMK